MGGFGGKGSNGAGTYGKGAGRADRLAGAGLLRVPGGAQPVPGEGILPDPVYGRPYLPAGF